MSDFQTISVLSSLVWGRMRQSRSLTAMLKIATGLLVVAGLLTLMADNFWLADLAANLRFQLVMAGSVGLAAAVLLKHRVLAAVQLLLLMFHGSWFLHPVECAPHAVGPADVTVTTINVYRMNLQYDRISSALRKQSADVIAVLEICDALLDHLRKELAGSHPYVLARPQNDGNFGIAIFSAFPLDNAEIFSLSGSSPSLTASVCIRERSCRVIATHPMSPMNSRNFDSRNRHLRQLGERIQTWRDSEPLVAMVLMGDLNLTPWSPHFAAFQQASGLVRTSGPFDVKATWYAGPSFIFGLTIDHCLVTPEFFCVTHTVGSDVGSDHRPVTVGLMLDTEITEQMQEFVHRSMSLTVRPCQQDEVPQS